MVAMMICVSRGKRDSFFDCVSHIFHFLTLGQMIKVVMVAHIQKILPTPPCRPFVFFFFFFTSFHPHPTSTPLSLSRSFSLARSGYAHTVHPLLILFRRCIVDILDDRVCASLFLCFPWWVLVGVFHVSTNPPPPPSPGACVMSMYRILLLSIALYLGCLLQSDWLLHVVPPRVLFQSPYRVHTRTYIHMCVSTRLTGAHAARWGRLQDPRVYMMPDGTVGAACVRTSPLPLRTVTLPFASTSTIAESPSFRSPESTRSASASSRRRMMALRSGRAP